MLNVVDEHRCQNARMPFTLAHPAAAVLIHRATKQRASLSALVIGSMIPDLVYFLPLDITARLSHSLAGILWFNLPFGLFVYLLFHLLLKRPMAALLPTPIVEHLPTATFYGSPLPRISIANVLLSLAAGALTHVVWDSFTHKNTFIARNTDILQLVVATIGTYKVTMYRLLQHISTVLGLLALALWTYRWMKSPSGRQETVQQFCLPLRLRLIVIGGSLAIALLFAAGRALTMPTHSIERLVFFSTVAALSGVALSALLFSIGWHMYFFRRR